MNILRFSGQVRKIRVVMLAFLLGLFGSFHLSIAQDGNDASSTLIDASSNNFPPMNVLDKDGNLTGFGSDLSDAVMKAVGRQVTHIHSPHWVQVLKWLDSGKADFIHDTGYTKDRDKFLDYSDPIIEMPEVIFVRPDQYDVTNIDSLRGKTVACVKKHISDLHLQKFPEINRHVVKTPIEGLYELIAGKVDAFIYPKQIVLYLAQKLRLGDKIKIAGDPLRILTWSMVVKEGNEKVLNLLNQGIAKVRESGEYERIYDKWWGKKILAGYSKRELYVITAVTTGGTLLIALTIALLFFNRRLKKRKLDLKAEIFEREKIEGALLNQKYFLQKAQEIGQIGTWELDIKKNELLWTDENYRIFGLPIGTKLTYETFLNCVHPDDREYVDKEWKAAFNKKPYDIEHRLLVDGKVKWVREKAELHFNEKDECIRGTGVTQDITERKEAEEELRESEERYSALFERSLELVYLCDLEGNFVDANHTAVKSLGYTKKDMKSLNFSSLLAEDQLPLALETVEEILKTGFQKDVVEYKLRRKDGEHIFVESKGVLIYHDGKPYAIQGIARDITERKLEEKEKKKLETKLQRAQKMEAMGLMAGGIAHDLNNILSGIVSYPELLLMDIPEDSPMWKPIKTIQESGMRAADVVEDLMTIARGVATSKEVMNFNTVVEEYLNSTEHRNLVSIRPSVTFETRFDSDLLNVNGSPTHMKKVLMNLVTNASEAIESSGTVIISTINQYLDEPLRGYEDVVTGEYAMLTISDDGQGISQQDLERIFEPFYTKKVMDRSGTGLGLAVVWNTVQDHKGYVNVKSSEKGTVFELYFPVTREELAAEKEEVPLGDYLGHGEKILVVDDEERQREIACGILTKLGYNAEAVSSGEEAVEYVKEHPVDLMVLDMVMPKGINGRKTYEEIIKIHPKQKAIIASGYAKTKEVELAQELGAGKYIKKPYTLPKVGLAVKEELEK